MAAITCPRRSLKTARRVRMEITVVIRTSWRRAVTNVRINMLSKPFDSHLADKINFRRMSQAI